MSVEATLQLENLSELEIEREVIQEKKVPLDRLLWNGADIKLKEKFALEAKLRSTLESMKYKVKDLFELKFNENRIFDIVGGKDKFHALKILDIPANCSYYSKITKLEKGQSVMRGVFAHRPFIAFCFSTGNSATRKVAFYYRNNDHYKEWKVSGTGHQLFEYGSYDNVVNLEERIVQDLKQLITKGYFHKINSSYQLIVEDHSPQYS